MLFIDSDFTDGALISGYMAATEAKVRALQELHIIKRIVLAHQTIPCLLALHSKGKRYLALVQERLSEKECVKWCIGQLKKRLVSSY